MKNLNALTLVLAIAVVLGAFWFMRSPKVKHRPELDVETPAASEQAPMSTPVPALVAPPATGTPAPLASASPVARPAAEATDAQAKFHELTREVMKSIPTKAELQKLTSQQVHYTPQALLDAGDQLGRVAEALRADPSLANEGVKFYGECAMNAAFANSVRALCVHGLEGQLSTQGRALGTYPGIESVPENVRELAEKLSEKN